MADEETTEQPTEPTTEPAADEKTVPYSRFKQLVDEKNAAIEELAGLRASVTELKAGHSSALDALQAEVAAATERAAALEADKSWSDNLVDLAREGITDPEITEFLRYKYDHAEKADDATFGGWFAEYKATEPAVLRPFTGTPAPGKAAAPKAVDGTSTPGSAKPPSAEDILSMSREEWAAQKDNLIKTVKF